MKSYEERLPLIDAAIENFNGDMPSFYNALHVKQGSITRYSGTCEYDYDYVCTRDEFEKRKAELAAKGQDMNDWYEKGGLPPVGEVCISVDPSGIECSGEVVKHSSDGECALFVRDDESIVFWQKEFRPLRTERDALVEKAINVAGDANAECDMTFAGALIDAGWRPTKPMSEQEFMKQCVDICGHGDARLYRAGCRFIEQVKA